MTLDVNNETAITRIILRYRNMVFFAMRLLSDDATFEIYTPGMFHKKITCLV